jgi:hypothetical protein
MIASRLVTIAKDIVGEYARFGLIELLQQASALSSRRPNLNDAQYGAALNELKTKARDVLNQNVFRTYPIEILKLLSSSEIHSILPSTIANMLIAGFPNRKEGAISSAEINMHIGEAQRILVQINGFISFADRLGVKSYVVPETKVAIDLKLPRALFNNELKSLEEKLSQFTELFESITEFAVGSRERVELVYISTTDPVFSVAIAGSAAYAILKFYKLLLEIAEKHINLYKALQEFKKAKLEASEVNVLSTSIDKTIDEATNNAIDTALDQTQSKVDDSRRRELRIQIGKQSILVVSDIAAGARIFISLESQQQLSLLSGDTAEDVERVRKQIEEQKVLESRLDRLTLDGPEQMRISVDKI